MKKILILILAIVSTFAIPYGAAKVLSEGVMKWLHGMFSLSTAGNYFLGALSHRVIHFLIAMLLLMLIFKREKIVALFDFSHLKRDMVEFRSIFISWPVLTVLFFGSSMMFVDGFSEYLSSLYASVDGWMLSRISRDFFLLDAIPEEVFYRAFMIGLLSIGFSKYLKIGKFEISHAALLSIPLFALSHVQVLLYPFKVLQYDSIQLVLTMLTGFLFAYAYEKTRSLVLPILIHGYTNLVITVSAYAILYVLK